MDRKQVLKNFLENLHRISNKDYQERIWINGLGPDCHDFDEAVCDFFDDGNLILKDYSDFELTPDQYQILKHFRDKFRIFADANDLPEEFIDTPEWAKIMSMAKDVLKVFGYTVTP